MYVVAVILESSDADLDSPSIAREALACCVQLVSVSAVYRILDRLEGRNVVTWKPARKGPSITLRSDRRYKVTVDGQKVFERSLGLLPIEDRGRIARKARGIGVDRLSGLNNEEDT